MVDVLTQVLESLRLHSTVYCQSRIMKTQWALEFAPMNCAGFHIVSEGNCWFTSDEGQFDLQQGDLLMLPCGSAHQIGDQPDAPVCASIQLIDNTECLLMQWGDDGPATTLVCGMFAFEAYAGQSVFSLLPPIIHLRAVDTQRLGLSLTMQSLVEEANAQRPGRQTVLTRQADVLFVKIIRAWLSDPQNAVQGWLGALRDPYIATALCCIHANPDEDWTVQRLANAAAMSRSAFAARFADLVGETPFQYLTRWRMQVAAGLLMQSRLSISTVAGQVGYESDLAFSKAFKRQHGLTPAQYQRELFVRKSP